MPQNPLLVAPPPTTGQLKPGEKNRKLGKDVLGDFIDMFLGAAGVNDPFNPDDVSTATSMGAALPFGGAGVALAKRLAPKKAVKELADVLLGRSKRLPPNYAQQELANFGENRLIRAGIGGGVTGSAPPPPTVLRISEARNSGFRGPTREIPRNPGLNEGFRTWQRALGRNLGRETTITINPNRSPELTYRPNPIRTSAGTTDRTKPKSTSVSLHDLGNRGALKIKSERELRNLLDGPQKAHKAGLIDRKKMIELLTTNKRQLEDYFGQLKVLGKGDENKALQNSLTSHINSILTGHTPRSTR